MISGSRSRTSRDFHWSADQGWNVWRFTGDGPRGLTRPCEETCLSVSDATVMEPMRVSRENGVRYEGSLESLRRGIWCRTDSCAGDGYRMFGRNGVDNGRVMQDGKFPPGQPLKT